MVRQGIASFGIGFDFPALLLPGGSFGWSGRFERDASEESDYCQKCDPEQRGMSLCQWAVVGAGLECWVGLLWFCGYG